MTIAVLRPDGLLRLAGFVFRAAYGQGGMTGHKREGDGATPIGLLPLRRVLYRADRIRPPPACAVPIEPIARFDGWCDDPDDTAYNQMVALPYTGSHEELWRADGLYDMIGVLGWNDAPVQRDRGSAIFLHIARPDIAPTAGCIALAAADLRTIFAAGLTAIDVRAD